jgi:hypothetical protein
MTSRAPTLRLPLATLALALALGGCGGGVWFGIGDGDDPPDVSLAADVTSARPGAVVRLVAAASDDFAIDRVEFYRREPDGAAVLLARVFSPPYRIDAVMPTTSAAAVEFEAQAIDDAGQASGISVVSVAVVP